MKFLSADDQFSKLSSDVVVPMVAKPKMSWLKPTDQIDSWLDSQGLYRKHIARDASSLFRCVSEVVFLTQVHHLNVRRHCIQFAIFRYETFKKLTNTPVKDYVERLSNPREWGTALDMEVMSLLYGLDFAIYKEIKKPLEKVTNNGFKFSIILSMSYEHHYDSVYPKQHIMDAAICQSIFYEILYKYVFKLEEVDYAVYKMLHDKTARHETELDVDLYSAGFQMRLEMRDNCRNVKDLLNYGITPFTYKAAKALDPNIYRNVEYDAWSEPKKKPRNSSSGWSNKELQVGSPCCINFNDDMNQKIQRRGHIQEMSPNKGPVVVFVEGLGEKLTVPYESLELIPVPNQNDCSVDNEESVEEESLSRLLISHDTDKKIKLGTSNYLTQKQPSSEQKVQQAISSELCSVHYAHSTTTVVPSTRYACVTSPSFQPEMNEAKSTQFTMHTNVVQERSKAPSHEGSKDQSMQYTLPIYPVMPPDMSVPPTMTATNLIPSKNLTSNECIDNNSIRMMYNRPVDSYYRFGYSSYPYCMIPPGVVYPVQSEPSVQPNVDARLPYSYPLPQVSNEMMYAVPMPNTSSKTELPIYPTSPPVYPASPPNIKNPMTMAVAPAAAGVPPPPYPMISSNVCSINYSPYMPPFYYHPYDYCISCPDMQGCENVASTYPLSQYLPVAYSDEGYAANAQIYCQPLLPVSHAQ